MVILLYIRDFLIYMFVKYIIVGSGNAFYNTLKLKLTYNLDLLTEYAEKDMVIDNDMLSYLFDSVVYTSSKKKYFISKLLFSKYWKNYLVLLLDDDISIDINTDHLLRSRILKRHAIHTLKQYNEQEYTIAIYRVVYHIFTNTKVKYDNGINNIIVDLLYSLVRANKVSLRVN